MPMPTVEHIANVSFKDHFLSAQEAAPKNGSIQVNSNTFDVTFVDGKVNAKFTSGNWFTNLFRSNTLARFTQTLQTQYDNWITEQAAASGFKDNPNIGAINSAIDEAIDVLYENHDKIDAGGTQHPKEVMKAFAMPNADIQLSDENYDRLVRIMENDSMPKNMATILRRLGDIGKLAALRNQLTRLPTGTACNELLAQANLSIHIDLNNTDKSERNIKRYVINLVDSVINGFLEAMNGMKDKNTQVPDLLLHKLDGGCLEAKVDNLQQYIEKSMNAVSAGRSEEKNDLAFSATAEFKVLADEVRAPFLQAARTECEKTVREECEKAGIKDEATIQERINERAETMVAMKEGEIAPLVRQKLEKEGKSILYENLCGALRPVTNIVRDEPNDKWIVTTLVDKEKKPVMKPVSAYDIDKNFDKLVDMYMGDAYLLFKFENKTRTTGSVKFATQSDLCAKGVIDTAKFYAKGSKEDFDELVKAVKSEVRKGLNLPDDKFEAAVRDALDHITGTKKLNDDDTEVAFRRLVSNIATSAYKDKRTDGDRLVYLLARGIEQAKGDAEGNHLDDIEGKAWRCAHMLKTTFKDKVVDVEKAQKAIADTIKTMVEKSFNPKNGEKVSQSTKTNLGKIMFGGRLFTDQIDYDIGHRAARGAESRLINSFNFLLTCVEHYNKTYRSEFIHEPGQKDKKEVAA